MVIFGISSIAVCSAISPLLEEHTHSLRLSKPMSFTISHSTSPDRTTLPAQHFRSLGFLCRWSEGLELATGQSPQPGTHRQQLQTIAENEAISSLPLSTHSAVEMLHDSVLYKSIIDMCTLTHRQCQHYYYSDNYIIVEANSQLLYMIRS